MAQRLQFDQWQEDYRKKMVTAEEAARVVKSGDRVVLPNIFLGVTPTAIFERRAELNDVEIQVTAPPYDPGWFLGDADDSFHLVVDKFLAPIARQVHEARRVDFLPYTNGTWWLPYRDHRQETRPVSMSSLHRCPRRTNTATVALAPTSGNASDTPASPKPSSPKSTTTLSGLSVTTSFMFPRLIISLMSR